MGTLKLSLPDTLRDFVDDQAARAGYGTSSQYVCELIRRDQERMRLRAMLLEGAQSAPTGEADAAYFVELRQCVDACNAGKQ